VVAVAVEDAHIFQTSEYIDMSASASIDAYGYVEDPHVPEVCTR